MPTKLSELLRRGWCQLAWAQKLGPVDALGQSFVNCHFQDSDAVCFCFLGGLRRLGFGYGEVLSNLDHLRRELFPTSPQGLTNWNDDEDTTHEQVIQLAEEAERRGILTYSS